MSFKTLNISGLLLRSPHQDARRARHALACVPARVNSRELKPPQAAKSAAKAAKEPKAAKVATKKATQEEPPAAVSLGSPTTGAAGAEDKHHVTPNLGLAVTVSVLPESRRRLRVRGTTQMASDASPYLSADVFACVRMQHLADVQATLPLNVLKASYDSVLKELGENASLPGFRKGASAPPQVLVAAVGSSKFRAACVEHVLQATLEEIMSPVKADAFQDSERITSSASTMAACFGAASCAPSAPLVLEVECDVMPTVAWTKPYDRMSVRVPAPATDGIIAEDAEKMMRQKLRDCGELRVVSEGRGIAHGDVARLNVSAAHIKADGTPGDLIMSMQHRNMFYDTENDNNLPGFNAAVAGMKTSETRTFKLTFPQDWSAEALRGSDASFTVHCTEHFYRTLPDLTDTLAPRLRDGCTDLESVRAAFLADARARAVADHAETTRAAVLDELVRCAKVEVPQSLFDETGRQLYSAKLLELQAKGQLSPVAMRQMMADSLIEQYFKHNGDDIRAKVVAQLAVIDVARRERLEADPERVAAEVARGKADFKRWGQECDEDRLRDQAQEGLLSQAVIDWLVDRASVTHV